MNNFLCTKLFPVKKHTLLLLLLIAPIAVCIAQETYVLVNDSLDPKSITNKTFDINEIEVRAKLSDANLKAGSVGLDVDIRQLALLPKLAGESDPFKALQYMGGVSQAGEANSGLYVRGGNNDQNLILLNGSLIQNPTHVFGMFSVFNPDLIGQMRFIKSGIPAEYGGRLSSVVDISTAQAIPAKIKVDGSIGLISSRIATTIPVSSKFAVYGAWRGSYISSIVLPAMSLLGVDSILTRNKYEYWDANTGFIWNAGERTKISGHFYTGKDEFSIRELKKYNMKENTTGWQNTAAGLQLNHIFSDEWSMSHQVNYSGFGIKSLVDWDNASIDLHSEFDNITYKADFFHINGRHKLKFGLLADYTGSVPHFMSTDTVLPVSVNNKYNRINSSQLSFYFRDEITYGKLQLNAGIRTNVYAHLGPYTDYGEVENITYARNKIIKTYSGIEPRFFARYLFNAASSAKIAATRHYQYLNQIPVFSLGIPADLQIPASLYVEPQSSWHFSGGYFRNLTQNNWEASMEVYYKTLENQLEFKNGIESTFTNKMSEKELLKGKGWTYGAEWKISKNYGKLTGWLTYNLAWSYRQFDGINAGNPFLARNDRRHDISVVSMYELDKKWNFSAVFVYATGSRLNLPLSWFMIENNVIFEYGRYNAFKMPAYHRIDVSANYKLKSWRGIRSELNFSVYNLYNRANPFQVFYSTKTSQNDKYNFQLKMSYLLPIIPSVSWTFHY